MKLADFAKLNPRQQATLIIAIHVRNELEDFHVDNLSDKQMKALNQTTRQAIYEALGFMPSSAEGKDTSKDLVWLIKMIPDYWEVPK